MLNFYVLPDNILDTNTSKFSRLRGDYNSSNSYLTSLIGI